MKLLVKVLTGISSIIFSYNIFALTYSCRHGIATGLSDWTIFMLNNFGYISAAITLNTGVACILSAVLDILDKTKKKEKGEERR